VKGTREQRAQIPSLETATTLLLLFNPMNNPDFRAAQAYLRFRLELWITAPLLHDVFKSVFNLDEQLNEDRRWFFPDPKDPRSYEPPENPVDPLDLKKSESWRDVYAGTAFVVLRQILDPLRQPFINGKSWTWYRNEKRLQGYSLPEAIYAAGNCWRHFQEWGPDLSERREEIWTRGTLGGILEKSSQEIRANVCFEVLQKLCADTRYESIFDRIVEFAEALVVEKGLLEEAYPVLTTARSYTFESALSKLRLSTS